MVFVNPDESWSSKTKTFGYDQQICAGFFPILVTIRELPFKNHLGRSPAKWKAREDKIEEAKKQKTPNNEDQEWNSGRWKPSSWTWNTSPSSSTWQERNSDKTRERSDWQSPADWSSSDQTSHGSEE